VFQDKHLGIPNVDSDPAVIYQTISPAAEHKDSPVNGTSASVARLTNGPSTEKTFVAKTHACGLVGSRQRCGDPWRRPREGVWALAGSPDELSRQKNERPGMMVPQQFGLVNNFYRMQ